LAEGNIPLISWSRYNSSYLG